MTLFLRNRRDETVVEVEIYTEDGEVNVSSSVAIEPYSEFLVANIEDDLQIKRDFGRLQNLNGWFWNVYMEGRNIANVNQQQVADELRNVLQTVANEYGFIYGED